MLGEGSKFEDLHAAGSASAVSAHLMVTTSHVQSLHVDTGVTNGTRGNAGSGGIELDIACVVESSWSVYLSYLCSFFLYLRLLL